MQVILENEELRIEINRFGAELTRIYGKKNDTEYLWNADPKYWKRSSPVLFPFVGSLKNKEYRFEGKTYPMGQHGFARDMEFVIDFQSESEAWFSLTSNEETLEKYPFEFVLRVGYQLQGRELKVLWQVENPAQKEMYFSIGGHPAFMCPLKQEGKQSDYYLKFDSAKPLSYGLVNEQGLMMEAEEILQTENGIVKITDNMFDRDALVIERRQATAVSLCTPDQKEYLTVRFDAPLFGVWSPAGKGAPFICIEPWYGRCDRATFNGSLEEREYGNTLKAQETFKTEYVILIG